MTLWVAKTSSTSCDQPIFMDESADSIGPINPTGVDVLEH